MLNNLAASMALSNNDIVFKTILGWLCDTKSEIKGYSNIQFVGWTMDINIMKEAIRFQLFLEEYEKTYRTYKTYRSYRMKV